MSSVFMSDTFLGLLSVHLSSCPYDAGIVSAQLNMLQHVNY